MNDDKKTKSKRKVIWIHLMIFSILLLGISCQKNNSSSYQDSQKSKKNNEKSTKDLSLKIPVTREELKNWIPIRIGDFKIIKTVIGYKESVEMSAIKAIYGHQVDSTKQIVVEVLDGAGPVAAVLLSGSFQKLNLDFEELKADGFSRIHERNGQRVWESEYTSQGVAEIEFIHAGRFLVSIKGNHLRNGDLWIFTDKLNFEGLK
jgi:hypothetical protein